MDQDNFNLYDTGDGGLPLSPEMRRVMSEALKFGFFLGLMAALTIAAVLKMFGLI